MVTVYAANTTANPILNISNKIRAKDYRHYPTPDVLNLTLLSVLKLRVYYTIQGLKYSLLPSVGD